MNPAGNDTSIQYNDNGNFGGAGINYAAGSPTETLATPDAPATSDTSADNMALIAGNGDTTGAGGGLAITSGTGGDSGNGGDINILAGDGGATLGTAGAINITAGNAHDNSANGGNITLQPGTPGMYGGEDGTIVIKGTVRFDPTGTYDLGDGRDGGYLLRSIYMSDMVHQYHGFDTHGFGFPTILDTAYGSATGAVLMLDKHNGVGADDGTFWISVNVTITTATSFSFSVVCTYTDPGNTTRNQTLTFLDLSGAFLTTITDAGGTVPYASVPVQIRAKAGTFVTINSVGTFTSVAYAYQAYDMQLATNL